MRWVNTLGVSINVVLRKCQRIMKKKDKLEKSVKLIGMNKI